MPSLTVRITPDRRSAVIQATFTGGDPEYIGNRRLHVELTGAGPDLLSDISSIEQSGPDGTFLGTVQNALPGRTYQWTAVVRYWDGTSWQDSEYSSHGSFVLPGVLIWTWDGAHWIKSILCGFENAWGQIDLRCYDAYWKG